LLGFCFSFLRPNFAPQFFSAGSISRFPKWWINELAGFDWSQPVTGDVCLFACLLLVAFVVIFLLPILFSLLFYALRIFLWGFFSEVFCNVGCVVVVVVVCLFLLLGKLFWGLSKSRFWVLLWLVGFSLSLSLSRSVFCELRVLTDRIAVLSQEPCPISFLKLEEIGCFHRFKKKIGLCAS
jgi:hypothetical protein